MKRICFVTTISNTIKAFLLDLAKYLVENDGYDVTFICDTDHRMNDYIGSHIHYIPVPMKRGVGFDGIKVIYQLTNIFKREQFNIVQYSTPNAALYASIAAKLAGVENRLYCQWGIRYMGFKGFSHAIFKVIEKITCKCSTYIESESFSLQQFSLNERLYKEGKSAVIWNGSACGVNLGKFDISHRSEWRMKSRQELGLSDNAIVFGYVGRITCDKGVNELFAAFKKLENLSDVYLLLVGSFDNESTINSELKEWALKSPKIKFVDWTPNAEYYYCAMDVFISLSYREGFGLVVIEAAAMGLSGIVTDVPGQMDTVVHMKTGINVPSHSVNNVIEAIKYFIENPNSAITMGKAARKAVEDKFEQKQLFAKLAQSRNALIKQTRN